ncbi:MAG: protein-glutamate O-methyltransferase family protein [Chloroflexi bacterium]|nr:protein-glutamate O-methyltransferase family protein [Chloroflexota bacterium]
MLDSADADSFACFSLTQRHPNNIRNLLENGPVPSPVAQKLERLIAEIPSGTLRMLEDGGPDSARWQQWLAPYQGKTWLEAPYFFAETYLFRRILEASGYYLPGSPWFQRDPFGAEKHIELERLAPAVQALIPATDFDRSAGWNALDLSRRLYSALWANRMDLTIQKGLAMEAVFTQWSDRDHLVMDDSRKFLDWLQGKRDLRLAWLADNAGAELFFDLWLAGYLLSTGLAAEVTFYLKDQPIYLSDAVVPDVHALLATLDRYPDCRSWVLEIQEHLDAGRLRLCSESFSTAPLTFPQMAPRVPALFRACDLVVLKGDINYRRLIGDRVWPEEHRLEDLVPFMPAPVLLLRSLKSEICLGVPGERRARLAQQDPQWMTNGRWGMIQFLHRTNIDSNPVCGCNTQPL